MIPLEIADLAEILLRDVNVTNSESQALRWAWAIFHGLKLKGYELSKTAAQS